MGTKLLLLDSLLQESVSKQIPEAAPFRLPVLGLRSSPVRRLNEAMDNCCSDEKTQKSYSQMVSSLSSWLRASLGQGETVEWLLSGLLLLHLLVILFFVFSRGNASAFLQ